jgi:hypothetical protein
LITVQVPTTSYLRKFALHRANAKKDGRIIVRNVNSIGITMWKILSRKTYRVDQRIKTEYPTHITFLISEYMYSRSGFELTDSNITIFNRFLKSQFEEGLFDFITINISSVQKSTIDEMIMTYLEYYGINENERSLESLLKSYQRWRKARNYRLIKY